MSTIKNEISVQLFSLREQLKKNYEETIKKVAEFGYKYVEPAGFPGSTIDEALALYRELGLTPYSVHGKLPLGDDKEEAIESALKLGAKYIVGGRGKDVYSSADNIKRAAEDFSEAAINAAEHGIGIGCHNHDWEMNLIDGIPGYRIFMENTPSSVTMELDTYWIKVGGMEPVEVIREAGERARLIHIKDGDIDPPRPMKAAGDGKMDFPPIIEAAKFAELFIVEIDVCGSDMLDAVGQSYDYLKSII